MKRYFALLLFPLFLHGQCPVAASGSSVANGSINARACRYLGTAAPGSVTGNLPGDLYTDTTNHNEYVCNAPSGTAAPACTSVTAAGWVLIGSLVMTTGSGAPSAACAVPTSSNLAVYWDFVGLNLYYCSVTTPTWQKFSTDGAGKHFTGAAEFMGLTSGGAGFTVNDIAGTSILYILPAASSAGQIMYDTGAVTCPTLESYPTSCHQLAVETLGSAAAAATASACTGNNWSQGWTTGSNNCAQPAFSNISGTAALAQLPVMHGSCTEAWGGSGTSFALTSGDDSISNNTCYNDSGATRTITAIKCRSNYSSNGVTLNPTFGSAGTGTAILTGAVTCGNSYSYSATGTLDTGAHIAWTTGTGIDPAMGGTLTNSTSIALLIEYTYQPY